MVYSDKIIVSTKESFDVLDITPDVDAALKASKIKDGVVTIFVVGSTAAITTIEMEENLLEDFREFLEKIAPQGKDYQHNAVWADANGFSHLRASLLGPSLSVPVSNGELTLGKWQQIVLCNFDNRSRQRNVIVKIIGEKD